KAPQYSWSPVPPFQLRGEPVQDLTTNSGFVSFDITSRHVEGKRLDTTVWNLLNFYAYVEYRIKCSRGYIQRRMRKGMDSLVKKMEDANTLRSLRSFRFNQWWISLPKFSSNPSNKSYTKLD
ncbi:unnamed protein product, partial [Brassica rapa]